jgi:hypothetical protein
MNKIIYCFFLFTGILIISSVSYSQDKVFLASEDGYVIVVEYMDWNSDYSTGYAGKYEFIYPGQTPAGDYEGDVFQDRIIITFGNNTLNLYKNLIVEGDWQQNDTLKNASISLNQLTATDTKGRFVTLKYTDTNGNIKSTKGLLLENSETKDYSFYEKMKD